MDNKVTPEQLQVINKALEERIVEANKDKTKWKNVLPDLMAADVFVVARLADAGEAAPGKKRLDIMMIMDKNGHSVVPFFTSPAKMSVLVTPEKKTFDCMKLNTIKLFQTIKGKTAVLNPNSAAAKLFTPFDMNVLVMEHLNKSK